MSNIIFEFELSTLAKCYVVVKKTFLKQDPQPPEPWSNILDVTIPGNCAMAFNLMEAEFMTGPEHRNTEMQSLYQWVRENIHFFGGDNNNVNILTMGKES